MRLLALFIFCAFPLLGQAQTATSTLSSTSFKTYIKPYPEARKAYRSYQLKLISGSIIGTAGVGFLSNSVGRMSSNFAHNWKQTMLGVGLIGMGLWVTKGAKKHKQMAMNIVKKKQKKKIALHLQPRGISISFPF